MKKILIWGFAFLLSVGAYGKELNEYLGKVQTLEKSKKYKEIDTTLEANKNNTEASKIAENVNNEIKCYVGLIK